MCICIKLCIDKVSFNSKPKDSRGISNRLPENMVDLPIEEIANRLVLPYGNTWTPAYFKPNTKGELRRTNDCWAGQTLFAIDIDEGISLNEVLIRCKEYNIEPAFAYSTFSSISNNKFRVIWQLPFEVTDARVRNAIQFALMALFPESDASCKDASRMFFGGKELIHTNFNATLDIAQVIDSMCQYITVTDKHSNYQRKIKDYCRQTGLDTLNGLPYIERLFFDVNATYPPTIYYYRITPNYVKNGDGEQIITLHFSPNISESEARSAVDKKIKFNIENTKIERTYVDNVDFDELMQKCQLFRELSSGEYWAYHDELFGIATNLLSAKGGRDKFMQVIKSSPEYDEDKWSFFANYINKRLYLPKQCDNYCPFADKCEHGKNMIEQVRLVRGTVNEISKPQFKTLADAELELDRVFAEAMTASGTGIHVIKAPTGIGKTRLYLPLKNVTIAVPTHKLKDEVVEKMTVQGNNPLVSPNLPLLPAEHKQNIDRFYNTGNYQSAGKYIKKLADKYPELSQYVVDLEAVKNCRNTTLLTTHERLLYLKDTNDCIIIDEDILPLLLKIDNVSTEDLMKVWNNTTNDSDYKVLLHILEMIKQAVPNMVCEMPSFLLTSPKDIETFVALSSSIKSNVLGFLNATHFIKSLDKYGNETISFINKRDLPLKKIIILSATANETVYKLMFGDRVQFTDIGNVETKGNIIQYPKYSFSKARMNKDAKLLDLAKALVGNNPVITYKDFAKEFPNCICTFGNTEGFDTFSGQDIFVVGALHLNPIAYLLYANALGHKPKANDCQLQYVPVKRNGFEFYFQTFSDDDVLREIQIYLIESELIQAIGRARILRNDCTVTVLSNLPIVGAEFKYLSAEEINTLIVPAKDIKITKALVPLEDIARIKAVPFMLINKHSQKHLSA